MADYDYTDVNTGEDYTDSEMEDIFQEWLDDSYGEADIAGYSMSTGRILREVDYIAFREEFNNWIDNEITEGNYREYVDSPVCEDCGEDMDQDEVTVALADHDRLMCVSCEEDENMDYCYECDKVTEWDDEKCAGCGRTWGYDKGEGPNDQ